MTLRATTLAALITIAAAASPAAAQRTTDPAAAQKQLVAPGYKSLQKTLEEKFAPPATRSLAPEAPALEQKDFQWVDPKALGKTQKPDEAPSAPTAKLQDKQSSLEQEKPASGIKALFTRLLAKVWKPADGTTSGDPGTIEADSTKFARPRSGKVKAVAPPRPPEAEEAKVPVAKTNSYMIQLKPEATEAEINTLLEKYKLNITNLVAPLGIIQVELIEDGGGTRGLSADEEAAEAEPKDAKEKLQQILEPQIIKDLRQETVVDAAFVDSTVGTKRVPAPVDTKVQVEGQKFRWTWGKSEEADGNWGLKAIRMPAVWTVLDGFRAANPEAPRPKIGLIDTGFANHGALAFKTVHGRLTTSIQQPDCELGHGTHVAGIVAARPKDGHGIDGMIPDAKIDAVAISAEFFFESEALGAEEPWQQRTMLFSDVLTATMNYLVANYTVDDNLRVINVSLAYNWLSGKVLEGLDPDSVNGLKLHIADQAKTIRNMARLVEDKVLFVVAAGNDSEGREKPLEAKWASPFAWAGTHEWTAGAPTRNILVVEATGRDGTRATFSNTGGHISAPGVDIMSTLAPGLDAFGVCSGTSQAAPHVTALAAVLFELDPTKRPEEVIAILKETGTRPESAATADVAGVADAAETGEEPGETEGDAAPAPALDRTAPVIDALQAVLKVKPDALKLLADLDRDGSVGKSDVAVFTRQLSSIEEAASTGAAFTEDLNGDGIVDDNECYFPHIDLNGSGSVAAAGHDIKPVGQANRSDLQAIEAAWTDTVVEFKTAAAETGLDAIMTRVLTAAETRDADAGCRKPAPPQ